MTTMQTQRLELTATDLVITLLEIKQHLIVEHDNDDALISGYVQAGIAFAESRCERSLRLRRFKAFGSIWPYDGVLLRNGPVRRVESVSYLDTDGVLQTLATDKWQAVPHNGEHMLSFYESPPCPKHGRKDAVSVTYVAGYGALLDTAVGSQGFPYTLPIVLGYLGSDVNDHLPDTIRQAVYMLVGHWYENRETVTVGTINSPMALAAEDLLKQERVMGV